MTLKGLGPRICVMGPSNSGKSTLAAAIGRAHALPTIHLDQLYHLQGTDWLPRPDDEFRALHDAAILEDRWVVEGNYSRLLPQRLARATGFVLLDVRTATSLLRYFRRTCIERDQVGGLEGAHDSISWAMIRHLIGATRANRKRYRQMFADIDLPKTYLPTSKAISAFYRKEGLQRASYASR